MTKGYPIIPPLQTKVEAESSIMAVTINTTIVASTRPDHVQWLLTMNSVAQHAVTN
jgi:hypothetical protein